MVRTAIVVLLAAVVGCASAPKPRAPDESRRTPVNRVVPPEVEAGRK